MKHVLACVVLFISAAMCVTLSAGDLKVNLSPQAAVKAGARWAVDGGPWKTSGATVKKLSNGTHQVTFKPLNGWVTPAPISVQIVNGTTTLSGVYEQPANVRINLTPSSGQWRIDGGSWQASGATMTGQTSGNHWVEYSTLAGYTPLPAEAVSLTGGQTTTLIRSYAELASFSVVLDPVSAQWRLDGGTWNASGAMLTNLSLGDHTVEFGPVDGYVTPDSETVTLVSGANPPLSRTYEEAVPVFSVLHRFEDYGNLPIAIQGSDGMIYCAASTGLGGSAGHVFRINPDGTGFNRLTELASLPNGGSQPNSLIEGSDGILYGTTNYGTGSTSTVRNATIFKVNRDGSGYTVLYVHNTVGDGSITSIIEGSDGVLYGTIGSGSVQTRGRVFRMNRDGSEFTILRSAPNFSPNEGYNPVAIVESPAGALIVTARKGGTNGNGTIFRLNKDGSGVILLKSFAGGADGTDPQARVLLGSDGALYGSTRNGGSANRGLIFRMNADGTGYQVLRHLLGGGDDGALPEYAMAEDPGSGRLYGFTLAGGITNRGVLFSMEKSGSGFTIELSFTDDSAEGWFPKHPLVFLSDGSIFGATWQGGGGASGTLFNVNRDGTGLTPLLILAAPDGMQPWGAITLASDGSICGTTFTGGSAMYGTVFRLDSTTSDFDVLHHFDGATGSGYPVGAVIEASNSYIYGTTWTTSAAESILFRTRSDGTDYSILHRFTGGSNGSATWTGVIEGSDGYLYGSTVGGGNLGLGTVYRIRKDGTDFGLVWSFAGGAGGSTVHGSVIEGNDGRLYGTTFDGGASNHGIVYGVGKDGSNFTVLHNFEGGPNDGASPFAGLTLGSDGLLYGTSGSLIAAEYGVVFRIGTDGSSYQVLHTFSGQPLDGGYPGLSPLIEKDGRLYGVTYSGGIFGKGTLFRISRDGSGFEILINFGAGDNDAAAPYSISLESDGNVYGVARGWTDGGAVFKIELP